MTFDCDCPWVLPRSVREDEDGTTWVPVEDAHKVYRTHALDCTHPTYSTDALRRWAGGLNG